MPFFSVSCESNASDPGVDFSGFDISTGKTVGGHNGYYFAGNPLGFILILPPLFLLALAFCISTGRISPVKKPKFYNTCKFIFFIAPLFDIFAASIILYAFRFEVFSRLDAVWENIPISVDIKYGFILYLFFNAAVFALAVRNYFIAQPAPPISSSHQDA